MKEIREVSRLSDGLGGGRRLLSLIPGFNGRGLICSEQVIGCLF